MRIDGNLLVEAVSGAHIVQGSFPTSVTFSIDSRTLQKGDIFIALAGAKVDGHIYLTQVLDKQCGGIIIAEDNISCLKLLDAKKLEDTLIITVPSPYQALISLACAWRKKFTIPLIAITGSVGKTSTKNILATIIKNWGKNYMVTPGNENTMLGVALNILRLQQDHDGAIFEVGINQRGEMARIIEMLLPTTSVITSIGHSHMQGLGTLGDIATEKRDIFKYLKENNVGFINGDQPVLAQVAYTHPVVKFGLKTVNQIQARKITTDSTSTTFVLKIYKQKYTVFLPNNHSGAVLNSLAATAVAYHLGVSVPVITHTLTLPIIVPGRFERKELKIGKGVVINDCYNANPESMKAALLAFQKFETNARKIAILGDMLELGTDTAFWHRQLGRFLRKVPTLQHVVLVGTHIKWTHKTLPIGITAEFAADWQEALLKIQPHLNNESVVLIKGSRGMGLTNIVDHLTQHKINA